MDITKEKYTMTEVCDLVGINAHQIRNWEKTLELQFPRDERNRRFFTQKDIDILVLVREGMDKSLSLVEIRKQLIKTGKIAEQAENAIQQMEISNLTPIELKEVFLDVFKDIILEKEEQLKKEFEDQLRMQLEIQKQEIQEQIEKQSEMNSMKLETRIREQIQAENDKLIQYIAATREEEQKKSFWSKLFNK